MFAILMEVMLERSGAKKGKATWHGTMEELALGVLLRLGLNADYDRILELANQQKTIRQVLDNSEWLDEQR